MTRSTPLPPPFDERFGGRAFTADQARAAGVGRGRLRGRDLGHPHHGIYVTEASDDLLDRCAALSVALGASVLQIAAGVGLAYLALPKALQIVHLELALIAVGALMVALVSYARGPRA